MDQVHEWPNSLEKDIYRGISLLSHRASRRLQCIAEFKTRNENQKADATCG